MRKFIYLSVIVFLFSTFNSCKDPCEDCICIFGDCLDGTCYCDPGYTGSSCDIQITPTLIKITRIDVLSFPSGSYDIGSGPDIYLNIYKGNQLLHEYSTYFSNANAGQTYTFNYPNYVNITNPNDRYSVILYDYDDTDTDDYIYGIEFSPYTPTNNFPSSRIISLDGFSFEIFYEYEW